MSAASFSGAHCSTKGGLGNALRLGRQIGCAAVQVFTSSPQQWYAKPVTNEMVFDFKEAQKETGITSVVSHDSYLVNLCAPTDEIALKSYKGLYDEIFRCALYGISFVVSHMGSAKGQPEAECLVLGGAATNELLDENAGNRNPSDGNHRWAGLLVECLLRGISGDSRRVQRESKALRLSGYLPRFCRGLRYPTPETFMKTFDEFDRIVGFDRLKVVHCNDSKRELGSRIDRHEHIGQGMIGDEAFRCLVNDPRFENIPILLETEAEGHEADLAHLRSLAGVEVGAKR